MCNIVVSLMEVLCFKIHPKYKQEQRICVGQSGILQYINAVSIKELFTVFV